MSEKPTSPPRTDRDSASFYAHRTLVVGGVVLLFVLVWHVREALLLGFAGLLIAVFVLGLARAVRRHTPLTHRGAVVAVSVGLVGLLVLGAWLLGPRVAAQFGQLADQLPASYGALREGLGRHFWGRYVVDLLPAAPGASQGIDGLEMFSQLRGIASRAMNAVLSAMIVLFSGIYFVVDPGLYRRGVLHLVPPRYRDRAGAVLDAAGRALGLWLLGRFAAILFVAVAVATGLFLLGVPLALVLGLIAGVLDFVPFIGPTVAAVPGILLAFTLGPTEALWAALLYFGVQQVEGNLVTPLIQQKAVSLPPVVTLLALTGFGLLFGLLGILLATPLLVVAMVFVEMLYVEDALGDRVDVPGREA